jgi:hypothetical protein
VISPGLQAVAFARRSFAALILTIAVGSSEPGVLVVRVIENTNLAPLRNAEVIDLDSRIGRFTDDSGVVRVPWPAARRLHLRIRQLGFKPVERIVDQSSDSSSGDSLRIVLERVAFALPQVVTREARRCESSDSVGGPRAVPALEQLRLAAERYESFRRSRPFRVEVERRTITLNEDGKPRSVRQNKERVESNDWGDPYVPGEILHHEPAGFSVSLLFLAALADSSFWTHHCFSVRGISSFADQRVVEMDFSLAAGSRGPDWEGTALIDSSTSMLRRLQFRLTGLPENETPRRLEGYTTFRSPSPYITIPDSTIAYWWRLGPSDSGDWHAPDIVQLIHVVDVRYKDNRAP